MPVKINKILIVLLCIVFVSVPLTSFAKDIVIKLGYPDPPATVYLDKIEQGALGTTHVGAVVFKRIVEKRTNGKIKVKLFPSMQLGGEAEMIQSIQEGTLEASYTSFSPMSNFVPEVLALNLPYLFNNTAIAYKVLEGPVGKELDAIVLKKMGIRILNYGHYGYKCFTNNKKPIRNINDFKGIKLRVMERPDMVKLVESLGAHSTPMAWSELYTALQTGVVDGQDNPLSIIEAYKLWEVQKYIFADNHVLGLISFNINERLFQSLSPEYRNIVKEAAYLGNTAYRGAIDMGNTLIEDFLGSTGVEITYPTAADLKVIKDTAQKAVIPWVRSQVGDAWMDKVLNAVKAAEKDFYN